MPLKLNKLLIILIPLITIVALINILFFHLIPNTKSLPANKKIEVSTSSNYLKTEKFFDKGLFNLGLTQVSKLKFNSTYSAKLAVFPHHTVPSYLISGALSNITAKHIVLLGPDHKNIAETPFTTTSVGWSTYFGNLEVNTELKNELSNNLKNKISINNALVEDEHSIAGVAPYIKYHNKESDLLAIVVSPKSSLEDLFNLAEFLNKNLENTPVIAAIDFSHYLTSTQAESKDKETNQFILDKNYKALFNLKSDHLDDPKSLIVILKLAELNNLKTNIVENTNSGVLLKQPFSQTTSYFLITFTP